MVVIRLARTGRKKLALYRIVAADKKKAATGKFIEVLGRYNPHTKELVIDKEKISDWMKKGAQPSNRVLVLLKSQGVKLPPWASIKTFKKAKKVKQKDQQQTDKEQASPPSKQAKDEVDKKVSTSEENGEPRVAEVASDESDKQEEKQSEVKAEIETPEEIKKEQSDKQKEEEIAKKITEEKNKDTK